MASRDAKAREPRASATPPSVTTASIAPQHGYVPTPFCRSRIVSKPNSNKQGTYATAPSLGLHHRRSWLLRFRRSRCTPPLWSTPCPPHQNRKKKWAKEDKRAWHHVSQVELVVGRPPTHLSLTPSLSTSLLQCQRQRDRANGCVRRRRAHVDVHTTKKTNNTDHTCGEQLQHKRGWYDPTAYTTHEQGTGWFSWSACKAMDDRPGDPHRAAAKNLDRWATEGDGSAAKKRLTHMKW